MNLVNIQIVQIPHFIPILLIMTEDLEGVGFSKDIR